MLVLLPLCALLASAIVSAAQNQRDANRLRDFRSATRQSFLAADVAQALAAERAATAVRRVRPTSVTRPELVTTQRRVDAALRRAERQVTRREQSLDVAGRLDAARRQLEALRVQAAAGSLSAEEIASGYSAIADSLFAIVRSLDASRPAPAAARAADAYLALLQAIEAAERERVNLASALAAPRRDTPPFPLRWVALEAAQLDAFRQNAGSRLTAELDATLFHPASVRVRQVREQLVEDLRGTIDRTSLGQWLTASGVRIGNLRRLEDEASAELATATSDDLGAAEADVRGGVAVSVAVLVVVTGLGLVLQRSITRPLGEVAGGARKLSRGDLAYDVSYVGRDEIGDVAAAFRDLRTTAEGVTEEIRTMNVAIEHDRLDHRADVEAFEGRWAQLIEGMNATTETFAGLQRRQRRAEREVGRIFDLSLDLLCISGVDGYFKRANPAFERTLGYSSEELLSRPLYEFLHPDDRERTRAAVERLGGGTAVVEFENRYIHRDGSVRWLQWNARPMPEEGLIYSAARDVTESRRTRDEQAALRRVATLVAKGVPPAEVFAAVAREVGGLFAGACADVRRYERDGSVTVLGSAGSGSGAAHEDVAAAVASARTTTRTGGAVGAPIVVEDHLWGVIAASAGAEPLPPDAEARLAHFTELVATAIANAEAQTELAASRARIVVTADQTRRRIERDLHDGAQQWQVQTVFALKLAQQALDNNSGKAAELVEEALESAETANDELRELLAASIQPP